VHSDAAQRSSSTTPATGQALAERWESRDQSTTFVAKPRDGGVDQAVCRASGGGGVLHGRDGMEARWNESRGRGRWACEARWMAGGRVELRVGAREEAGRAALQLGRAREARRGSSEVGVRLYRCGSEPQTSMVTWRGHRRTT
jgi:hypothetical protein